MYSKKKKILSFLSAWVLAISLVIPYTGYSYAENIAKSRQEINESSKDSVKWVEDKKDLVVDSEKDKDELDHWMMADLGALEIEVSDKAIQNITKTLFEKDKKTLTKDQGKLLKGILALRSQGVDVENFLGYNLIEQLCKNINKNFSEFSTAPALMALDSGNYKYSEVSKIKDELINQILENRNKDGVWEAGEYYEDATGFCLYALAPHMDRQDVKEAVEKAYNFISDKQQGTGDIVKEPGNSNSFAMVAGAILSIDSNNLTDEKFVKDGNNFFDALKNYDVKDTADFKWKVNQTEASPYAKEQSFRMIASYLKNKETGKSIYDFKDTPIRDFTDGELIGDTGIIPNKIKKLVKWAEDKKDLVVGSEKDKDELDYWMMTDLGALGIEVSDKAIQNITKTLFEKDKKTLTKDQGKLLKGILALRSQGVDVENFLGYNLIEQLCKNINKNFSEFSTAPALMALDSGNYKYSEVSKIKDELINQILENRNKDGVWEAWGYYEDATGFCLYALAPHMDRQDVKEAVEKAYNFISDKQQGTGDIVKEPGNSNSFAMVAGAILSIDSNNLTDEKFVKDGNNFFDALKNYDVKDTADFKWKVNQTEASPYAKEQSFRMIASYLKNKETGKSIYDFGDVPIKEFTNKQLIGDTGIIPKDKDNSKPSSSSGSSSGGGSSSDSISVYFRLDGMEFHGDQKETWIEKEAVKVSKDSYVKDVFEKSLKAHNIDYKSENNYVSDIKSPFGEYLGAFTNGKYSGWMYSVNGKQPDKGYAEYKVNDKDYILWYYTNDYTNEDSSKEYKNSSSEKSSGGGGGGSDKSSSDKNSPSSEKVEAKSEIKGDTQKAVIDKQVEKEIEKTIEKAVREEKKEVVIDVKTESPKIKEDVKKIEVPITKNIIEKVSNMQEISLKVKTDKIDITLDKKAVDTIKEIMKKDENISDIKIEAKEIKNVENAENIKEDTKFSTEIKELVGQRPIYDINIMADGEKIRNYEGGKLTISIPYKLKPGENKNLLTVYYIKDDGSFEEVKDAKYDVFSDEMIFSTNHLSYYAIGIKKQQENSKEQIKDFEFSDVKEGSWYFEPVNLLAKEKVISGVKKDIFAPEKNITRAEFLTMLYRLSKSEEKLESDFKDVSKSSWYYPAVSWAYKNEIAKGFNGSFYPEKNITRQEMAVILSNYIKNMKIETKYKDRGIKFKDGDKISNWAKKSVEYISDKQIMIGDNQNFNPYNKATRAQAAMTIYNIIH